MPATQVCVKQFVFVTRGFLLELYDGDKDAVDTIVRIKTMRGLFLDDVLGECTRRYRILVRTLRLLGADDDACQ